MAKHKNIGVDSSLIDFLETVEKNSKSMLRANPGPSAVLEGIDSVFRKIATNLHQTQSLVSSWFLFRSHSSFRAAVRLASAGQLPESYMVARGCLESAQYGLHVHVNESAAEIWLRRDQSKKQTEEMTKEFKKAIITLRKKDQALGEICTQLYDTTISYGGHPNPSSILTNMELTKTDQGHNFSVHYLSDNNEAISLAHKTVAQVGVTGLNIFYYVYKERFDLLGLPQEIKKWATGL